MNLSLEIATALQVHKSFSNELSRIMALPIKFSVNNSSINANVVQYYFRINSIWKRIEYFMSMSKSDIEYTLDYIYPRLGYLERS